MTLKFWSSSFCFVLYQDCKECTITSGFTWCWGSNPHPNMLEGILPIHTHHQLWYLRLQFWSSETRSCHVNQAAFEYGRSSCLLLPEYWDSSCTPPCPVRMGVTLYDSILYTGLSIFGVWYSKILWNWLLRLSRNDYIYFLSFWDLNLQKHSPLQGETGVSKI